MATGKKRGRPRKSSGEKKKKKQKGKRKAPILLSSRSGLDNRVIENPQPHRDGKRHVPVDVRNSKPQGRNLPLVLSRDLDMVLFFFF